MSDTGTDAAKRAFEQWCQDTFSEAQLEQMKERQDKAMKNAFARWMREQLGEWKGYE